MRTMRNIPALLGESSRLALASSFIWFPLAMGLSAQTQTSESTIEQSAGVTAPVVPQQVRYAAKLATRSGDTVEAVFSIYAAREGGEPLWTETQKVTVDQDGSYSVLLGSASAAGLPQTLFAGGVARWLGVSVERAPELPRALFSSVPYAMKSADAQALAGHPAGDFVTQGQLSQQFSDFVQSEAQRELSVQPLTSGTITGTGTAGTIPQFTGANTIGNSVLTQSGTSVGVNEATPAATFDVNGTGQFRGTLTLPSFGTANTSNGSRSQELEWEASVWSATSDGPVTPIYKIYAGSAANNTANPTATLLYTYQVGTTGTPSTIMSLNSNGSFVTYGGVSAKTSTVATATAGASSPLLGLIASTFSSKTSAAVAQNFGWQAVPTGNDTASPSSNIALVYSSGPAAPTPTGLSISSTGLINWATGQTFPITGTAGGTVTSVASGTGLTGGPITASGTLSIDSTKVPLLSSASNNFTGALSVTGAMNGSSATFSAAASPVLSATDTATGAFGQLGAVTNNNLATGVFGSNTASNGYGVTGIGGNTGVYGNSTGGNGVFGSGGTYGVSGYSNGGASGGVGVYGTGSTAGVSGSSIGGTASGELGTAVESNATGVYGSGIYGVYGTGATGVYGSGTGNGIQGAGATGVYGSGSNFGVYGSGTEGSYGELGGTGDGSPGGFSSGVFGMGGSDSSTGVTGLGNNLGVAGQSTNTGVYGYGGTIGVEGFDSTNSSEGVLGTATNGYATGVYGNATTYGVFGNGTTYGVAGESSGYVGVYGEGPTYGVYSDGAIGSETYTASVAALPDNRVVEFYAVASTENWFEDYGTAQLRSGSVTVTLDPTYAQAVNTDGGYHVFITPDGDCEGLYVTRKTATSFEVHELHAGKSNIEFDYRIVARRRGFEGVRMEQLDADSETVEQIRDRVASRPAHRMLTLHKPVEAARTPAQMPPAGFPIHPAAPLAVASPVKPHIPPQAPRPVPLAAKPNK